MRFTINDVHDFFFSSDTIILKIIITVTVVNMNLTHNTTITATRHQTKAVNEQNSGSEYLLGTFVYFAAVFSKSTLSNQFLSILQNS